jgi:acyl-CoA synthetase (AMP-forming)/AMP-acid ligase II
VSGPRTTDHNAHFHIGPLRFLKLGLLVTPPALLLMLADALFSLMTSGETQCMEEITVIWLYLIIAVAGALQAWGPPMNGALRNSLTNPWLASSFLPAAAFLGCLWLCQPRPLTTADGLTMMPWWAPLGGLVGAFAVVAGLLFVDRWEQGYMPDSRSRQIF